jgi:polyketide synthase PksN
MLTAIFEDFFGMKHIGVEDPFFELGGDSLKAMILLTRVKTQFGVPITLQEFLFNNNIKEIAGRIGQLQWLKSETKTEHEITI